MIREVRAEKERLVPDCSKCQSPCGKTDEYDMQQLWNADEDIRSLKSLILFGIRGMPAHAYPFLKKFSHLKGNFGTSLQNQQKEFDHLPAPVLYTTNCLMPPKNSYADRVFTTEVVAFPGAVHIDEKKDFTQVIAKALELGGYKEDQIFSGINGGTKVTTGFGYAAMILSRLVDTFSSRISLIMPQTSKLHNTACILS